MKFGITSSIIGLLSGFLLCLFYLALVLTWPARMLGLATVLGFAFVVILRRNGKPLQRWHLFAAWFVLGCALAAALLAILDIVFPPLT